jgi:uncharacterized protein (TIGR01319 family)
MASLAHWLMTLHAAVPIKRRPETVTHALLIDFGSTYTKLRAVDLEAATVVGSAQGPSTVTTDVTIGLDMALAELRQTMTSDGNGFPDFSHRLASSSAAGGLRMVTVGLVPDLTAKAARLAALGAGAKLMGTYAFELTASDINAIVAEAPDMVLLSGGTDGGNRAVIEHNAEMLAASALACPMVVAGNRSAADAASACLGQTGKTVIVTENVMPRHLELNIEPAREAIRQLFIKHIVHAKGIDKARDRLDMVLMPTPAAVLKGAQLLADGYGDKQGLGPLLVIDIGGATTDVHSICDGKPSESGVVYHGLEEPYAKRTVEGDLGMRHTAHHVVEAVGGNGFADRAGLSVEVIDELLVKTDADVEWLPLSELERAFDRALAQTATQLSVTRHAGTHETVYAATGPVTMQRGKDLTEVGMVIGTGGVLVHAADPAAVLSAALAGDDAPLSLRPHEAQLMLDTDYSLYACGLLADVAPEAALALGTQGLTALTRERKGAANDAATA